MNVKTLIPLTPTIEWKNDRVRLIDQTKLPLEEEYIDTDNYRVVCDAIYRLAIRGAPAIGVAGAYACVLAANEIDAPELNQPGGNVATAYLSALFPSSRSCRCSC